MKRIFIILAAAMMAAGAIGQEAQDPVMLDTKLTTSKNDSLLQEINRWMENIEKDISLKNRYKLYPTENMYTFLLLDTKTGKIEKVQWNLDRDKEFSVYINSEDLSYGTGSGTFELFPTQNMYQFLLVDKTNGRVWHVQWGMNEKERWLRPIY